MSATDDTSPDWVADSLAASTRSFDLSFAYDDPEDPSIVTVHPEESESLATTWISIDVEHAVPIENAR